MPRGVSVSTTTVLSPRPVAGRIPHRGGRRRAAGHPLSVFVGIGEASKIALVVFACAFPILPNGGFDPLARTRRDRCPDRRRRWLLISSTDW
jgi:hypothetical protein